MSINEKSQWSSLPIVASEESDDQPLPIMIAYSQFLETTLSSRDCGLITARETISPHSNLPFSEYFKRILDHLKQPDQPFVIIEEYGTDGEPIETLFNSFRFIEDDGKKTEVTVLILLVRPFHQSIRAMTSDLIVEPNLATTVLNTAITIEETLEMNTFPAVIYRQSFQAFVDAEMIHLPSNQRLVRHW